MRLSLPIYRKAAKCPEVKDNLMEHKQYIDKFLEDLPEIRNWKWGQGETQKK
jgi:phosphoketolase